eukprot:14582472-Alexandrium_andersonii.AAC.1
MSPKSVQLTENSVRWPRRYCRLAPWARVDPPHGGSLRHPQSRTPTGAVPWARASWRPKLLCRHPFGRGL